MENAGRVLQGKAFQGCVSGLLHRCRALPRGVLVRRLRRSTARKEGPPLGARKAFRVYSTYPPYL